MINMLITFRNKKWGCIRGCRIDGECWFVADDVMNSLGYHTYREDRMRDMKSLRKYYPWRDEYLPAGTNEFTDRTEKITFINMETVDRLVDFSPSRSISSFYEWLCEGILPVLDALSGLEEEAAERKVPYFTGPEPEIYREPTHRFDELFS